MCSSDLGSLDPRDATRQKLIRDGRLTLLDSNGRQVLKLDQLNEQNNRPTSIPTIPHFGSSGGNISAINQANQQSAFYLNLLSSYFNYTCVQSMPQFPCTNIFLNIFDQGVFDDNVMLNATNPNLNTGEANFFSNGYGGLGRPPTDYSKIGRAHV